ncbi:MAG: class I SAM-dependent methyltransferase [Candidatus Bipolaricaulia bacterium]
MSLKLLLVRALYRLKSLREDPVDIFKRLGVESNDQILEIGCAIGYHTLALAELVREGKIYAVDIWEEGLRFLRSRIEPGQAIEPICRSAEDIEFPSGSLDKIFCFDTLHELPHPEEAVQRWAGFLKEDGRFYFKDPKIPPEQVERFSNGRLRKVDMTQGIAIFAFGSEQGFT